MCRESRLEMCPWLSCYCSLLHSWSLCSLSYRICEPGMQGLHLESNVPDVATLRCTSVTGQLWNHSEWRLRDSIYCSLPREDSAPSSADYTGSSLGADVHATSSHYFHRANVHDDLLSLASRPMILTSCQCADESYTLFEVCSHNQLRLRHIAKLRGGRSACRGSDCW